MPPGATRDRISLTTSTASGSATTDSSSHAASADVPSGMAAARLTGARGWPAIPEVLIESSAQRARQLAFASGDYSGSVGAPDTGWGAMGTDRFWPQSLYNFLTHERNRFASCFISTVSVRR